MPITKGASMEAASTAEKRPVRGMKAMAGPTSESRMARQGRLMLPRRLRRRTLSRSRKQQLSTVWLQSAGANGPLRFGLAGPGREKRRDGRLYEHVARADVDADGVGRIRPSRPTNSLVTLAGRQRPGARGSAISRRVGATTRERAAADDGCAAPSDGGTFRAPGAATDERS